MQKDEIMALCDKAIISLANGDKEALGILYDVMAKSIYITALTITKNTQDAEDALQDTMLDIFKASHSYRADSNPRAFILTIARHRALDIVRRRKNAVTLEDSRLYDEPADDPLSDLAVFELLKPLNITERQIIIFRLYDGLPFEEISKIMHISVTAAQKRYQRVLRKLRKIHNERSYSNERERDKENSLST